MDIYTDDLAMQYAAGRGMDVECLTSDDLEYVKGTFMFQQFVLGHYLDLFLRRLKSPFVR